MGHWQANSRPWHEVRILNCDLCGQMVPDDIWRSDKPECDAVFCSPECEKMYFDYWLPRYGQKTKDSDSSFQKRRERRH